MMNEDSLNEGSQFHGEESQSDKFSPPGKMKEPRDMEDDSDYD